MSVWKIPPTPTWTTSSGGSVVLAADITDSTEVGRAVLTANTRAGARAALGIPPERSPAWFWAILVLCVLAVIEPFVLWLVLR